MEFTIRGDYITLGQLLKAAGAVSSGGEAAAVLASGCVRVNGEAEERRGRKLRGGDVITIPGFGELRCTAGTETGEPNPVDLS